MTICESVDVRGRKQWRRMKDAEKSRGLKLLFWHWRGNKSGMWMSMTGCGAGRRPKPTGAVSFLVRGGATPWLDESERKGRRGERDWRKLGERSAG